MGPREGVFAAALLLALGCGKSDPIEGHQWWYLKPGRYIVDRSRADGGVEAPPRSEGWRTIAWRIGAGDALRFRIEWSDARSEGDAIARITGRLEAGRETRLMVSVREGPPESQSISYTCAFCGQRWQSRGGGGSAGSRCPRCKRTLEQNSKWHSVPTREVRIRAVPPIAELDAEPSFRREGDVLVREIDRRIVPGYETDFDIAPYLGHALDGHIDRAVPSDIGLIFHLPPGDLEESSASRFGDKASYRCVCGGIRIEGDEHGYEIEQAGRVIPLSRYPLPVWRFVFRIEK